MDKKLDALRQSLIDNDISIVKTAGNKHELCLSLYDETNESHPFTDLIFDEEINPDKIKYKDYKNG